jgi:hypothetical protein
VSDWVGEFKTVKAVRKARACLWCDEPIPIGSAACSRAERFNGEFQVGYFHPECCAALDCAATAGFLDDGFAAGQWARGRTDDKQGAPPEFLPSGELNPALAIQPEPETEHVDRL